MISPSISFGRSASEIGLNGICIGAFDKERIRQEFGLKWEPLLILAIGRGIEKIELVPIGADGDRAYYREGGTHYVPKVVRRSDDRVMETNEPIYIRNMVCDRCRMVVRELFAELGIETRSVELGVVRTAAPVAEELQKRLGERLRELGFELLDEPRQRIVGDR